MNRNEAEIGDRMTDAFDVVRQVYGETGLLMETLDAIMAPDFANTFKVSDAVWYHSHAYNAGEKWLVTSVSRYWEKIGDRLRGVLVCIEFLPASRPFVSDCHGPLLTAMALHLNCPVKQNNWKFQWRDRCGWDREAFDIDAAGAPFYRSIVRAESDLEGAAQLKSVHNFWLPLSALNDGNLNILLVKPLKMLALSGTVEPEMDAGSYLTLR